MGAAYAKTNEDFTHTTIHQTECGKIRGKKYKIENDRYVNVFLGIPYAQPPIGELRFQKPEPAKCWSNVKECIKYSPRAPQVDNFFDRISTQVGTSEDCLYLNVFAPEWDPFEGQEEGRAVLVWIHGGGFTVQSAATYGYHGICKYLCSKGVVVVTLQYRLGILGFGATDTISSVPNLGLWDQALALKWIKSNIQSFGGNPNNITVFGQSAGAVCADILSLSPYTRELFHRVIPMGGSANCSWALRELRRVRDATMSFAYSLGWEIPDNATEEVMNASVMKFLRDQPTKALALGLPKRNFKSYIAGNIFGPVIDGDFIPEPIAELRTKTPLKYCMTGATDYEVLLYAYKGKTKYNAKKADHLLSEFIPLDKYCNNYPQIRQDAKQLYFTEHSKPDEIKRAYFQIASDLFVTNGIHDYAEDMLNSGHIVYLYSFEYVSPRVFGAMRWSMPFYAATHDTEIPFLFGKGVIDTFRPSSADIEVINTFTTIFTNFAKCGDPNGGVVQGIERLTTEDKWRYARITKDVQMRSNFRGRRAEFWRNLSEGKFLYEVNSKETQTDDEASASVSGSGKESSLNSISNCAQDDSGKNRYDQVFDDNESEVVKNMKDTTTESNTVTFDTDNLDCTYVLTKQDELRYCSFEEAKANSRQDLYGDETTSKETTPPTTDISDTKVVTTEMEPNDTYERHCCSPTTATNGCDFNVLNGFDDLNVVNTNQNFLLERKYDLEQEPINLYCSHYYDIVDPGEIKPNTVMINGENSTDSAVKNDVEENLENSLNNETTTPESVTDLMCQQILQENNRNTLPVTSTAVINDHVDNDEDYSNACPEVISTAVVCSAKPIDNTDNDSSVVLIMRKPTCEDVEVATQTSLDSAESDNDSDQPPFPILKQTALQLNDDQHNYTDESEWDDFD